MNTFEKLAEELTSDKNKQRLGSFLGVIHDIIKTPLSVTITEEEESVMTVVQENGVPMVKMSRGFLVNLGDFKLTVRGGFTNDTVYEPEDVVLKESFTPSVEDHKRLVANGWILIEKTDAGVYHFTFKNGAIDAVKDFNVLNHIKHNDLNEDLYKMVADYFVRCNIKYHLVGDVWPEKTCEKENVKIQYVDRPVISEKVVYVDKIVFKETPVYVDKVVVKEIYKCEHDVGGGSDVANSSVVSTAKPATKKVTTADVVKAVNHVVGNMVSQKKDGDKKKVTIDTKQTSKTLPAKVFDPDEDVDDKKPAESTTTESEESETSSSSESSESSETSQSDSGNSEGGEDEESSEKEPVVQKKQAKKSPPKRNDEASESTRKVPGRWLNDQKTIIKSGDYVYRLDKKIGETQLVALGKWNKKMWEDQKNPRQTLPLTKEDEAKIEKMGHRIGRKLKS